MPMEIMMPYATYIFPEDKKPKEKKVVVEEEVVKKKKRRKRHAGGASQGADKVPTADKLAITEAHLIELRNKIDRLNNENVELQSYLDERPDLHFDTPKTCCLLQNEDLYNWTNRYSKLMADYKNMPSILKHKQDILDNLKNQHDMYMTQYEQLEMREQLTKHLKKRAVVCNKEIENETKILKDMQERLSWMGDYHKGQLNGELSKLRKSTDKQRFAIKYYRKLIEKYESEHIVKKVSSLKLPPVIIESPPMRKLLWSCL